MSCCFVFKTALQIRECIFWTALKSIGSWVVPLRVAYHGSVCHRQQTTSFNSSFRWHHQRQDERVTEVYVTADEPLHFNSHGIFASYNRSISFCISFQIIVPWLSFCVVREQPVLFQRSLGITFFYSLFGFDWLLCHCKAIVGEGVVLYFVDCLVIVLTWRAIEEHRCCIVKYYWRPHGKVSNVGGCGRQGKRVGVWRYIFL